MVEDDIGLLCQDIAIALEADDRLEISKILSSIDIAEEAWNRLVIYPG